MIIVDVLIMVILVVALVSGLRRGFFASIGTMLGLVAGALLAYWITPHVSAWVSDIRWRGVAIVGVAVGLLVVGGALGSVVGGWLRAGVERTKLRWIDRLFGGIASVGLTALAVAFVAPAVAVAGVPFVSSAVASSSVLRGIDTLTPPALDTALAEARGFVLDEGLPALGDILEVGVVPEIAPVDLEDPELARAAASVARVSGTAFACGLSSTGSGFVIAADRVVTNAHVVAGVEQPVVELPGVGAREGRIVYFDPIDDLAVIAVDDLGVAALPLGPTLSAGTPVVVQGYPLGGPFTMVSGGVLSTGSAPVPDIYGESVGSREVYALETVVRPGNSGGPVLTQDGAVAGVVFARAEDDENRGYAMTMAELVPVAAQAPALTETVSTGRCIG